MQNSPPIAPLEITAPAAGVATAAPAPLLPAFFGRPAALAWLWLLPLAVLAGLNVQAFALLARELDATQLRLAHQLGLALLGNLIVGGALCAAALVRVGRPNAPGSRWDTWGVPLLAVAVNAAYLAFSFSAAHQVVPRRIGAWIYSSDRFLFNQFAFAMLPLALGILRLATARAARHAGGAIAGSVAVAIAAPVALFLLAVGTVSLRATGNVAAAVVAVGAIALCVAMVAALVRALMIGLRRARTQSPAAERMLILALALALPLLGLMLNGGIPFPADFQSAEVYALTLANAAALLAASLLRARIPAASLGLSCAALPFSLYFFIVFLPFTPLSIVAIVFFGAGLLLLSPTLLFVLHVHQINRAWRGTVARWPVARAAALALGCGLLLPAGVVGRAVADRVSLHAALDYAFAPSIPRGDREYPGSVANLRHALASHRAHKDGLNYPLLSDFYGWCVFNRLVLPDEKIARLETMFLGDTAETEAKPATHSGPFSRGARNTVRAQSRQPRVATLPRAVEVTRLAVATAAAGDHDTTVTLTLELTNPSANPRFGDEYVATLPLPSGVFASGFHLDVEGVAVPGRIFEKKSALWVYSMIRDTERRDPGVLYYRNAHELELRVFPVLHGKPSRVAIEFLVPGRIAFAADAPPSHDPAAVLAQLAPRVVPHSTATPDGTVLAGATERLQLPAVERTPYLHLIIDRSLANAFEGDFAAALRSLRAKFPAATHARVTLAHHDLVETAPNLVSLDELATRHRPDVRLLRPSGSLMLDHAVAHALRRHRDEDLDRPTTDGTIPPRPVFVVLGRSASTTPPPLDLALAWREVVPVLELHALGADGAWISHFAPSEAARPLLRAGISMRPLLTDAAAVVFKSPPPGAGLEFWSPHASAWQPLPTASMAIAPADSRWARAAAVHAQHLHHARSPGDSGLSVRDLVAASRESGVLLPAASYIVVENSAQWLALEAAEQRKLSQNTALEFRETPAPPALWVGLAFAGWLMLRRAIGRRRGARVTDHYRREFSSTIR